MTEYAIVWTHLDGSIRVIGPFEFYSDAVDYARTDPELYKIPWAWKIAEIDAPADTTED